MKIEAVFVLQASDGDAEQRNLDWLNETDSARFDRFAVDARAFEKISFGNRQEVVAVAEMPERQLDTLELPRPATIAVLERIEKPGNVGAVFRSADGAGIDAVVLVDCVSDLFNPNAIRASLGTIFTMPCATTGFDEFQRWSEELGLHHLLAKCDAGARSFDEKALAEELKSDAVAIVLGSESMGLTSRWDAVPRKQNVTIPMAGTADSLNISAAAAVFFYTFRGIRRSGPPSSGPPPK